MDSASLGAPTAIVILVLMLGATIYLWRARYIRPKSAFVLMTVFALAIVALGIWSYSNPMP